MLHIIDTVMLPIISQQNKFPTSVLLLTESNNLEAVKWYTHVEIC